MVKLEKIGFLSALVGGIVGLVFGLLNLLDVLVWGWYLGGTGLLGIFLSGIVAPIIVLVASGLALLIGLKTFFDILDIDLLIWAIVLIILGALVLGIGGYLIILGGIFLIIARFMGD